MLAKSILIFLLIFNGFDFCQAQIDVSNFNNKLLEHEVKTLIDSTRIAHNLPPLYNDSILYVAANHHAQYLVKKGELSHEEIEFKDFKTPQDRANFYGAPKSYLVGENIVFTPYNALVDVKGKIFKTDSYKEIARCLVFSWIKSKGHFQNIITPDYQITGLAIEADTVLKRIYAVQKFAMVIYTFTFEENKSFFPYTDINQDSMSLLLANIPQDLSYPFKLRYDKKEKCEECREDWEQYPTMSVRVAKNYFILRVEESDFVKNLIQNKYDGFAIELVPFDAFACGNPAYDNEASRRNGKKRTSGRILEPVYRNDLMKGFKKRKKRKDIKFVSYLLKADSVSFFKRFGRYKLVNFDSKYFEIKLGKVPKDMQSWWNHNLMYIHNKQICHFVFLTNYPGELTTEMLEVPYYPPIPVNDYEFELEYFKDTMELFYEAGSTVTSSKELDAIIAKYRVKNLRITDIKIDGFSSVEGDAAGNEILHQKRADKILADVKLLTTNATEIELNSEVAWDHFYANVKDNFKWKFLYSLSKSEISAYLNDPKNERPSEILKQERKVKIEILGVRDLNPQNANYYVVRDINALFKKNQRGKLECKNVETLEKIYEKAYYFSTVDTLTNKEFLNIELPKIESGYPHSLDHDVAFYRYNILKDSVDNTERSKLESKVESVFAMCGAAEHLSPEFHYLSACLLVEKIRNKKAKLTVESPEIEKAFDRLNLLLNWYELDPDFKLNVAKANLNVINILCEKIDPELLFEYNDIVSRSLIQIVEYYRNTDQLNPKTVLALGKLACYFKNISLAIGLCQDYLYDDEVLKLYLPLAYTHSSYLSNSTTVVFEIEFHKLLMEARQRLSPEDWCKLFYGEFGIPFQVMDNKPLHTEFCATCPNRVNEVLAE